jgi:hypothetical protein
MGQLGFTDAQALKLYWQCDVGRHASDVSIAQLLA